MSPKPQSKIAQRVAKAMIQIFGHESKFKIAQLAISRPIWQHCLEIGLP